MVLLCLFFADEYGSGLLALRQSSLLRIFAAFGTPAVSRAPTPHQPRRAAGMNGSAPLLRRWSSRRRSESRGRRLFFLKVGRRFLGSLRRAVQGFMFPVGEKAGRADQPPNLFLSLR
jgi:hypothetical protein